MSNRNVRSSETRENIRDEESRPQTQWTPPALLDAPPPRDGMVQRWVATSIQGKDTPDNVYKRMREGWVARPHQSKSVEQNESLAGDLNALEQRTGQKIFQERKSSASGGRQVSVMSD